MSGGGSAAGGYVIERSLRFNAAANTYLRRTFGTPTNAAVWTLSLRMKRSALGAGQVIFGENSANGYFAWFNTSDQIEVRYNGGIFYTSTTKYRDTSAHMHFMWVMNGSATKILVNGAQVDSDFAGVSNLNTAIPHALFCFTNSSNVLDGYLSEVHFVDGQALTPSSFGETNATTGQWVAKKYTGTYGTNGFYLDFKDGTSTTTLGYDKSGNNNHWTLTNFTRSAGVNGCWMLDVPAGNGSASAVQPSGNYCVWNPLALGVGTLSKGNLSIQANAPADRCSRGTIAVSTGKWFWEATITQLNNLTLIGLLSISSTASGGLQSTGNGVFYVNDGSKQVNSGSLTAYGATYTTNDVVRVELDLDNLTVTFFKNNVSQGSISINADTYLPAYIPNGNTSSVTDFNFGQRVSAHTPTAGFKALCTANLTSTDVIESGSFTGNANAIGPFIWCNGTPKTLTINGNAVTWGTHADRLANGFKLRTSSSSYNSSGTNTWTATILSPESKSAFKHQNAKGN